MRVAGWHAGAAKVVAFIWKHSSRMTYRVDVEEARLTIHTLIDGITDWRWQ